MCFTKSPHLSSAEAGETQTMDEELAPRVDFEAASTLCVRSGCGPTQGIAPWPDDLAEPPTRTGRGANEPLALVLHPLRSCLLGRTPTSTWSVRAPGC